MPVKIIPLERAYTHNVSTLSRIYVHTCMHVCKYACKYSSHFIILTRAHTIYMCVCVCRQEKEYVSAYSVHIYNVSAYSVYIYNVSALLCFYI